MALGDTAELWAGSFTPGVIFHRERSRSGNTETEDRITHALP
jgi:hypothetical protein